MAGNWYAEQVSLDGWTPCLDTDEGTYTLSPTFVTQEDCIEWMREHLTGAQLEVDVQRRTRGVALDDPTR
jgi:hypothetical protein